MDRLEFVLKQKTVHITSEFVQHHIEDKLLSVPPSNQPIRKLLDTYCSMTKKIKIKLIPGLDRRYLVHNEH